MGLKSGVSVERRLVRSKRERRASMLDAATLAGRAWAQSNERVDRRPKSRTSGADSEISKGGEEAGGGESLFRCSTGLFSVGVEGG
eukprot:2338487-Rhodomonas_salina.1